MEYVTTSSVTEITSENEIPVSGMAMLDCYAAWCGPCKRIAPKIEELSAQFPTIPFLKADVDQCDAFLSKWDIQSVPTFLFFKNGQLRLRVDGADLNAIIESLKALEKN